MLILLSSTSAARYREDVLRCLTAPLASHLQFRYRRSLISEELLRRADLGQLSGNGLVCFLDAGGAGDGPLRIVPVRSVEVKEARAHGTTISVTLEMKDFAHAEAGTFVEELGRVAKDTSPRRVGGEILGKYCFEVNEKFSSLRLSNTVEGWEKTVSYVRTEEAFQREPFFWAVLGIEKDGEKLSSETFSKWPNTPVSSGFSVLIYHYQDSGAPTPNSKLSLVVGEAIASMGPNELKVDSRYDLKRWRFEARRVGYFPTETWLRFRVADTWDLDLSLQVGCSFWMNLAKSLVIGILIALPSIAALAPQRDLGLAMKLLLGGMSLMAGVGAALAVVFGIEKIG